MIEKGFVYKHELGEEDVTRIIHDGEENEIIFEAPDGYTIDAMSADEHVNTIIIVLKRKEAEDEV